MGRLRAAEGSPSAARRRVWAVLLALVLLAPGPAAADSRPYPSPPPSPHPSPSRSGAAARDAAAAAQDVQVAAEQVRALTQRYRDKTADTLQAAAELPAAFAAAAGAQRSRDDTDRALREVQVLRAARVKALYTQGDADLALSALTALSPDDALWRLSTAGPVGRALLRADTQQVNRATALAQAAQQQALAAQDASVRVSAALSRLQEDTAQAQLALAQARATLTALTQEQQRLEQAQRAAEELAAAQAAAQQAQLAAGPMTALAMPAGYEQAYRSSASACPGMRWTLLAAVGQVESGHGRNNGPSSAGAQGPMQFMPGTFAQYGLDGNGDGRADVWDFRDAVPSAARYLCASGVDGTPQGDRRALFAYNRADWYVDLVLGTERAILERLNALTREQAAPAP